MSDGEPGSSEVDKTNPLDLIEYRTLFEAAGDAIFVMDGNRFVHCNHRTLEMFNCSMEQIIGKHPWDFSPPNQPDGQKSKSLALQRIKQTEQEGSLRFEWVHCRQNGDEFFADVRLTLIPGTHESRILALVRDISKQKKIETELRQERDLISRMITTSPVGITMVDRAGTITFANQHAERVLGLSRDKITQRTYNDPEWEISDFEGNELPAGSIPFEIVRDTLEPTFDIRHAITWPDGGRVFLSINASPLFTAQGEFDGMIAAIEDITQQIEITENIRLERDRAQQYFDLAGGILITLDQNGCINLINTSGLQILGYSEEEIIGADWFETCLPEHIRASTREVFHKLLRDELDDIHNYENLILTSSGEERIIAWHNVTLRDAQGTPVGTLSSGEDITERVRIENALREYSSRLETIHEMDLAVLSASSLTDIAHIFVNQVQALVHCDRVSVTLFQDQDPVELEILAVTPQDPQMPAGTTIAIPAQSVIEMGHLRDGRPFYLKDLRTLDAPTNLHRILGEAGIKSYINIPLRIQNQLMGSLNIGAFEPDAFDQDTIDLLHNVTSTLSVAIQNAILIRETKERGDLLQRLAIRLSEQTEHDRKRVASELHDRLGQSITTMSINLNVARAKLGENVPEDVETRLQDTQLLLESATQDIRNLMEELRPPVLDDYGIFEAIKWYATQFSERTGIKVNIEGESFKSRLSPSTEIALFRITQEALINIARHAAATHVSIECIQVQATCELSIKDDGKGFLMEEVEEGWGIRIMRERALAIGADLDIETEIDKGTTIKLELECFPNDH